MLKIDLTDTFTVASESICNIEFLWDYT